MSFLDKIDKSKSPEHVAIIMDGNGRWAKVHGLERADGHREGINSVKSVVEAASNANVKFVTIYAFSTENWCRPDEEINALMDLMVFAIRQEEDNLIKNNVDEDILEKALAKLTDKEEVKKYIDDDYCGFVFTANGFETLFSLLKQISGKDWYRAVPNDKPIFLIAGENDPVGEYGKGVNEVFMTLKKTGHSSVEMKLYPGDRHELLNEIDRDAVTKDITDWLNRQTKSSHVENAAEAVSEK